MLRYGPAGDSAPRLRLKAAAERRERPAFGEGALPSVCIPAGRLPGPHAGRTTSTGHDPRPRAPRLAPPARSHRRRRSAAAAKRPTCCKPSTPVTAARSPPSMRTTPTAPCPAWRAARMQGVGELPWDVTCRGVVDGVALVIHMTRREEAAIRGRSRPGARLRRRDHYMGQPPTRPRDGPRPSRTHRRILAVLAARQTGGPAAGGDARVRPHS